MVKVYKLFTGPATDQIERDVNILLSENPTAVFHFLPTTTGAYYKRGWEMNCPKCASKVVESTGMYMCPSCKRTYTSDEFSEKSKLTFTHAGTLFLQPLIYECETNIK